MIVFGGFDTNVPPGDLAIVHDDMWEWNGADGTWANLTPTVRPPDWPKKLFASSMVYDESRGSLVLFGGAIYSDAGPYVTYVDLHEWR